MTGNNTSFSTNPVPALIARRTTILAPPSLSTVNHFDSVSSSGSRHNGRQYQRSAHRSDLQQAVSQPTAAVPVSTRENISTSKTWSSGLAHKYSQYSAAGARREVEEEFVVHSTFRRDAENKGDVLVRVEGIDFFVHKDILLFSSSFFASVLQGEWRESRLSRLMQDEIEDTERGQNAGQDEAGEPSRGSQQHVRLGMEVTEARAEGSNAHASADQSLPALPHSTFSTDQGGNREDESEPASEADDPTYDQRDSDYLGGGTGSLRRTSLRASFHTAVWSQDDVSKLSSRCHSAVGFRTPDEGEASEAFTTEDEADFTTDDDEERDEGSKSADQNTLHWRAVSESSSQKTSTGLHQARSKSRQLETRLALRTLESARESGSAPIGSSDPFDLPVVRVRNASTDSSTAGPLERLESLATPPVSPRPAAQKEDTLPGAKSRSPTRADTHFTQTESATRSMSFRYKGIIAVVDLEEETAGTFQDFLFHIYPHLDLSVTWWNCGPLLRFSDKFQVPFLRRSCITFLRAALAGRPIEAMRLAELHSLDDLYREASRHVLDNFSAWEPDELEVLSKETLLKLERKRTWFLERLLKLGLVNPGRDYECHANCPDPSGCARLLHEKWQAAYANAVWFSPPQPTVIFRCLRELDGSGFLQLSACQGAARGWVQGLFDRMFGLGSLHTPRQFLAVKLGDGAPRNPVSRE